MPTMTLTAQFVREAACGAGRRKTDFFDFGQRGFLLEVRQSGGKTYYQRYTDERGRERQYKIGPADVLTLDQARRKAKQIVAEALLGADPQQKRREMRGIPLLKDFVAERYLPYVRGYKNSWVTDETVLRIHVLPKLGNLALDELKTEAISTVVNAMREDGYASGTMNRVIVILRYIYNLARKWKVPGGLENPAAGLSAGPDVQRNRFLSEEEAEALVRAIHVSSSPVATELILTSIQGATDIAWRVAWASGASICSWAASAIEGPARSAAGASSASTAFIKKLQTRRFAASSGCASMDRT